VPFEDLEFLLENGKKPRIKIIIAATKPADKIYLRCLLPVVSVRKECTVGTLGVEISWEMHSFHDRFQ